MNKYLVPILNPKVHIIKTITANSLEHCHEIIMEKYSNYSDKINYQEFVLDCMEKGLDIGDIYDYDEL